MRKKGNVGILYLLEGYWFGSEETSDRKRARKQGWVGFRMLEKDHRRLNRDQALSSQNQSLDLLTTLTNFSVSQTPTLKSAPPAAIALSSPLQLKEKIEALVVEAKNLGWE